MPGYKQFVSRMPQYNRKNKRTVTNGRHKICKQTSSREDAKRFGQRYIGALNMQWVQREAIGESIVFIIVTTIHRATRYLTPPTFPQAAQNLFRNAINDHHEKSSQCQKKKSNAMPMKGEGKCPKIIGPSQNSHGPTTACSFSW